MEYEDTTTIATPEGVELELRLAGVGSRFSSASLDYLIKFVVFGAFALLVGLLFGGTVATVAISAGFFLAVVVYDIVFEVRSAGATPGKRALGVRVLRGPTLDRLGEYYREAITEADETITRALETYADENF